MFVVTDVPTEKGTLQYREEHLTGLRCRISPERLKRHIDQPFSIPGEPAGCPFCRENIFSVTPTFADGTRILRGESVTFPNMFPFAAWHTVTVITRDHTVPVFTRQQIADALHAQVESLLRYDGYPSINWNYLPSAGASIVHPHMQGIADRRPSWMTDRYLTVCREFHARTGNRYWDAVREQDRISDRYLFGEEIFWSAHAVPVGEREVRGLLPVARLDELESYTDTLAEGILEVLSLYRKLGTHAFNMAIFFGRETTEDFSAFCSLISRINPNPLSTSDSAFMERLHNEPIILTLPEDLGRYYRNEGR
ncbi:galactose-1-phosphate uridylyltransferase [Methanoregula sp.]|uniref:galactose-1-phosphate uridylyltransferase n=1 Tax=Methanoregula sp. TaxID=2052170 RepID=UPI003BAEA619